jgi:general secretion pathway protein B
MINNVYLREGDGFSGLTLEEIGEFYVVLSYQGQDFKTPVLKDWQAP